MSTAGSGKRSSGTSASPDAGKGADPRSGLTRNRVLLAVLVLMGAAVVVWVVSPGEDPPDQGGSGSGSSPASPSNGPAGPALPSGPETATPSVEGPVGDSPIVLEPVPLDQSADFGDQVSAELVDLTAVQAEGQGVGEISGPAIRVAVGLTNGTSESLSLDAVTVILYFGPDLTPAPSISDPGTAPFRGSLAPGERAQGVYTFSIAEDDRDDISVTVSHSPASTVVVFTGAFS